LNNGFISLYRSLLEWEWYGDVNVTRLFVHCLLKANWKDLNFKGIKIERGSFVTSLGKLSEETTLSVKQIRVALNKLIRTGEVANNNTNKYRIVTLINYEQYQQEGKQKGKPRADKGQQYNKVIKETKEIYNLIEGLSVIKKITGERLKHLNARISEHSYEEVLEALEIVKNSDFLKGVNDRNWKCDFDWIMNPNNFIKILEGKYTSTVEQEPKSNAQLYYEQVEREKNNVGN